MTEISSRRTLVIIATVALALAAIALTRGPGRGNCPVDNPTIALRVGGAPLQVEVAANDEARFCGLAQRDDLAAGSGMLFVYSEPKALEFWMKDTRIPLALAFVDNDRRITEIHQLTPDMGERSITSAQPARFALEANPGWFDANGVSVGDPLEFKLPDGLVIE